MTRPSKRFYLVFRLGVADLDRLATATQLPANQADTGNHEHPRAGFRNLTEGCRVKGMTRKTADVELQFVGRRKVRPLEESSGVTWVTVPAIAATMHANDGVARKNPIEINNPARIARWDILHNGRTVPNETQRKQSRLGVSDLLGTTAKQVSFPPT